jgi:hypothetical protein
MHLFNDEPTKSRHGVEILFKESDNIGNKEPRSMMRSCCCRTVDCPCKWNGTVEIILRYQEISEGIFRGHWPERAERSVLSTLQCHNVVLIPFVCATAWRTAVETCVLLHPVVWSPLWFRRSLVTVFYNGSSNKRYEQVHYFNLKDNTWLDPLT